MDSQDLNTVCPFCGYKCDAVTGVTGGGDDAPGLPEPGNVSLCAYCGEYSFFDKGLKLRKPTHEEIAALMDDATSQIIRGSLNLTRAKLEGNAAVDTLGLFVWNRTTDEVRKARDTHDWRENFEAKDRLVARHWIEGVGKISTVFLGIDHCFPLAHGDGSARELFETALFPADQNDDVEILARYPNPEDARQSHERIVVALMERHAETVEQAREIIAAVRMRGNE